MTQWVLEGTFFLFGYSFLLCDKGVGAFDHLVRHRGEASEHHFGGGGDGKLAS